METEQRITIGKPIDEVFAYVADPLHNPEWISSVNAVKQTSAGPLGVGTTFAQEVDAMGYKGQASVEVTAYDPPHAFALSAVGGPLPYTMTYTFVEAPVGTDLKLAGAYEATGSMRMANQIILNFARKALLDDMAALKKLMER